MQEKEFSMTAGDKFKEKAKAAKVKRIRQLLELVLKAFEDNTPVITGKTRAAYKFRIDGTEFETVPSDDILENAKFFEIINPMGHIEDLNKRRDIIELVKNDLRFFTKGY